MNIAVQRPGGNVTATGGFTDNDTIAEVSGGTTIVTLVRVK
jgi:hypothetical protein